VNGSEQGPARVRTSAVFRGLLLPSF